MTTMLVQHTLRSVTGIVADDVVNTFHFRNEGLAANDFDLAEALDSVQQFFDEVTTTGKAVRQLLASTFLSGAANMRVYDLADAQPRPPRAFRDYTLGPRGGTGHFREAALVASFAAAAEPGLQPARLRGRVFLGPLSSLTADFAVIDNDVRPTTTTMQTVIAAIERMRDRPDGLHTTQWAVYSRVDNVARPVVRGWCDNAADTQRRRGLGATQRLSTA